MAEGGCLCGAVRWQVTGDLTVPSHCHCSTCRKANGAAFVTHTSCAEADFGWTAGADQVGRYATSPGMERAFCKTCGSTVPGISQTNGRVFMPLGCMEGDTGLRGGRHLFVTSKANWYRITDDLPQHDAYPAGPGMHADLPVIATPDRGPASPGTLRGSCLCGAVAYEVDEPFSVIHNCHCGRCRKARGAAHATNGFVRAAALRFNRGADRVTEYRLPGTRFFGQSFCDGCGAAVPRLNRDTGGVNVPLGALDDPTDARPDDHIFTASKANWYQITDDLPRFAGAPD